MRIRKIKHIFRKEILDTLRDRRTILFMIVIPVLLYPGMLIFINEIAASQQAKMENKRIKVAVQNLPSNTSLPELLTKEGKLEIVSTNTPYQDVKNGKIDYF